MQYIEAALSGRLITLVEGRSTRYRSCVGINETLLYCSNSKSSLTLPHNANHRIYYATIAFRTAGAHDIEGWAYELIMLHGYCSGEVLYIDLPATDAGCI